MLNRPLITLQVSKQNPGPYLCRTLLHDCCGHMRQTSLTRFLLDRPLAAEPQPHVCACTRERNSSLCGPFAEKQSQQNSFFTL